MDKLKRMTFIGLPCAFVAGFGLSSLLHGTGRARKPVDVSSGPRGTAAVGAQANSALAAQPPEKWREDSLDIQTMLDAADLKSEAGKTAFLCEVIKRCKTLEDLKAVDSHFRKMFPHSKVPWDVITLFSGKLGQLCGQERIQELFREGFISEFKNFQPEVILKGYSEKNPEKALELIRGGVERSDLPGFLAHWLAGLTAGGQDAAVWISRLSPAEQEGVSAGIPGRQVIQALLEAPGAGNGIALYGRMTAVLSPAAKENFLTGLVEARMNALPTVPSNRRAPAFTEITELLLKDASKPLTQDTLNSLAAGAMSIAQFRQYFNFAVQYTGAATDAEAAAEGLMNAMPEHQADMFGIWLQEQEGNPAYSSLAKAFAHKIEDLDPEAAAVWREAGSQGK